MLLLACCHHTAPPAGQRTVNTAISAILRKLQGSWISYEYTHSLAGSHSPYHSSAHIDGLLSFSADSTRESHDTLYLTGLLKGVEDNGIWIYLGKTDSTGRYYAGQRKATDSETAASDNITGARIDSAFMTFYTLGSDSIRFSYFDAVYKGRPIDYVLRHYTTQALFKGAYTTVDPALIFGSSQIIFDPVNTGRLAGSPTYDSFDINTDILAQKDTLDYMEFFDTHGVSESHSYSYRIKDNMIRIYPLGEGPPCRLTRVMTDTTKIEE
ncbi:MAG: hypothetical protein JWO03_1278 [Bacteroidetes bacterium]|nr:hypothetical protein [Bacteroidota bacterium]